MGALNFKYQPALKPNNLYFALTYLEVENRYSFLLNTSMDDILQVYRYLIRTKSFFLNYSDFNQIFKDQFSMVIFKSYAKENGKLTRLYQWL